MRRAKALGLGSGERLLGGMFLVMLDMSPDSKRGKMNGLVFVESLEMPFSSLILLVCFA